MRTFATIAFVFLYYHANTCDLEPFLACAYPRVTENLFSAKADSEKFVQYINSVAVTLHNTAGYGKLAHTISRIDRLLLHDKRDIVVSFSGGKEATLIVYLIIARDIYHKTSRKLNYVYFDSSNYESDTRKFVKEVASALQIKLDIVNSTINRDSVNKYLKKNLSSNQTPVIVLGRRVSDDASVVEYSKSTYAETSYTIFNPLFDMTYGEIWQAIKLLDLPYCQLYDKGYTHISNNVSAQQNKILTKNGIQEAYRLPAEHWQSERQ